MPSPIDYDQNFPPAFNDTGHYILEQNFLNPGPLFKIINNNLQVSNI